ncbi:MAG: arginine--tRNA ligase [Anaerofustis stercorihominis]|nr:arginine--tRNA ligase [Anaerofustis stercorihominis]
MDGKLSVISYIKENITKSIASAIDAGSISLEAVPNVHVEIPKDVKNGDFSSNAAMQLAKSARMNPRVLAQIIIDGLEIDENIIAKVEMAGAGFINFYVADQWYYNELRDVLKYKDDYGKMTLPEKKSINFEYVSANPTGPLHIGNARGGAVGDCISNIYTYCGWDVTREFYINDAGNQILKFGESIGARYMQLFDSSYPFPEDGYQGSYITDYAGAYFEKHGDSLLNLSKEERNKALSDYALEIAVAKMKEDLLAYGVDYDVWYSETSLHESGEINDVINVMTQNGATYEADDAVWFKATDYGCEKDEVLIRKNGIPTYYAADLAYHYDKFAKRKFDMAVNVWGADHHGHVKRMKEGMKALLNTKEEKLEVILMQLVQLKIGEDFVRLSKRKGQIVTLTDLIDEVGTDAARFMFNSLAPSTHMEFDLGLAIKQSNDNPVFYVQYAHARMCSIIRNINECTDGADLSLLKEKQEMELLDKLASFSKEISDAAAEFDPSRMTRYATSLAGLFHSFYNSCRVKCDDAELRKARLALVEGAKYVLKNTLTIIGVSAPEQM